MFTQKLTFALEIQLSEPVTLCMTIQNFDKFDRGQILFDMLAGTQNFETQCRFFHRIGTVRVEYTIFVPKLLCMYAVWSHFICYQYMFYIPAENCHCQICLHSEVMILVII